jgi:hypothetical protein
MHNSIKFWKVFFLLRNSIFVFIFITIGNLSDEDLEVLTWNDVKEDCSFKFFSSLSLLWFFSFKNQKQHVLESLKLGFEIINRNRNRKEEWIFDDYGPLFLGYFGNSNLYFKFFIALFQQCEYFIYFRNIKWSPKDVGTIVFSRHQIYIFCWIKSCRKRTLTNSDAIKW